MRFSTPSTWLPPMFIGLAVSVLFILNSNLRRPIRRIVETHLGGNVLRLELANQVSFRARGALREVAKAVAREEGVDLKSGVYAAMSGPTYETPAEIRMLRTMGADLVGKVEAGIPEDHPLITDEELETLRSNVLEMGGLVEEQLRRALAEFARRQRRFGLTSAQLDGSEESDGEGRH